MRLNAVVRLSPLRRLTVSSLSVAAWLAVSLTGCSTTSQKSAAPTHARVSAVTGPERQASLSPDAVLALLKEGNGRFVSGQSLARDYPAQAKATSEAGQFPLATVLACLDSRVAPELVFDKGIGDLFVARVAGNFATEEILGSMEFASKVVGSKLIVVKGHTKCGAVMGACDGVQLGNLTSVMDALQPAVKATAYGGDRSSKSAQFVHAVTEANVRQNVEAIRQRSPLLAELERNGKLKIVGAMHDLSSGTVTFLD